MKRVALTTLLLVALMVNGVAAAHALRDSGVSPATGEFCYSCDD